MTVRGESVERTRERILQAAFDLWRQQPYDDVTLDTVAAEAGVSRQTVHRQFGSKDELFVAVTEWVGPREEAASLAINPGDVTGAVRHEVERYERLGDANVRFLQMEGRVPAVDSTIERGRAAHRAWIEHVFAPHLPDRGAVRERAILALYAATDVMVWKLLRRDFSLSQRGTQEVMQHLVEGALRAARRQTDAKGEAS
jgi:AcrR family transcriptional regulator